MSKSISKQRWERLRQRMIVYGIQDVPLTAIPEDITEVAKDPSEAAGRLLMLLAIAFSASNSAESDRVADWLKREDIWQIASESEKLFFREGPGDDSELAKLSFRFEGAYMLAWALKQVAVFPDPSSECEAGMVGEFFASVPPLLGETDPLFEDAKFRRITAIHDEYLFYKMALLYFRHIAEMDKENTSNVHQASAYERYLVLEWLLDTSDPEWDELIARQDDDE